MYNYNCKSCETDNNCNLTCKSTYSRSCLSNQYLQLTTGTCGALYFGTCKNKISPITSQNFFVGIKGVSMIETSTTFSGSGSFSSPFSDLIQALIQIYQISSIYTSYNATIFLLNEDHFILNKDYNSIALSVLDYNPQVTITIQPLYCSSLYTSNCFASNSIANVYIRYSSTVFYIFSNLIINNVNFDAIEMLNSNDMTRKVKCVINPASTLISPSFTDNTCQSSFNNLQ